MDRRHLLGAAVFCGGAVLGLSATAAKKPPTTWDNLVLVKSKKMALVYLKPGADFRGYKKVMLDPTEVAFHKDWKKDFNNTTSGLSSRVRDSDIETAVDKAVKASTDIFTQAFTEAGYTVSPVAGPDVLRVRTGVIDISVSAPDRPSMGRSYTFANEAGFATLFVEVRDSETNDLLGRAIDRKVAGDTTIGIRNSVTNRSDFRMVVKRWAKVSAQGLQELKSLSPVSGA